MTSTFYNSILTRWKHLYSVHNNQTSESPRKQLHKIKRKDLAREKRNSYIAKENYNSTPITSSSTTKIGSLKTCRGGICLNENDFWHNQSCSHIRIPLSLKQCQRCSKYATALKKCISIGNKFIDSIQSIDCDWFKQILDICRKKKQFYEGAITFLIHLQNTTDTFPFRFRASTGHLLDNIKLSCHMFFQSFGITHRKLISNNKIACKSDISNTNSLLELITHNLQKWNLELQSYSMPTENRIQRRLIFDSQSPANNLRHKSTKSLHKSRLMTSRIHHNEHPSSPPIKKRKTKHAQPLQSHVPTKTTSDIIDLTHASNITSNTPSSQPYDDNTLYTLLISNIIRPQELLSTTGMGCVVSLLRRIANRNTFISSAFITEYIRQEGGKDWAQIGRLFRNNIAASSGDGLYILPAFSSVSGAGHWSVILILIQDGTACGYSLDSLGTHYGPEKLTNRQNIMEGFSIQSLREWNDIPIMLQTELECGPRSIWNMIIICMARKHHITMNNIFVKLRNLGGLSRNSAARQIRMDVQHFLITKTGSDLFNRIFPQP